MVELSARLEALLKLLTPCHSLGDIGSDHGKLIVAAVRLGLAQRGVAVEINRAPYEASLKTVLEWGLEQAIEVRLGDGLLPLAVGEVDAICIAGMGGGSMVNILTAGNAMLAGIKQIILQPNVDVAHIRRHLLTNGYSIVEDGLVLEGNYIYQLLRAEPGGEKRPYSQLELEYGRHNLARKDELQKKVLAQDIAHWQKVEREMRKATVLGASERRQEIQQWIDLLKGALDGDNL